MPTDHSGSRTLMVQHGECVPQPSSDWNGTIPLPLAVAQFYEEVGPVDVAINGPRGQIVFPSLAQLWSTQVGYRWDGRTGEPVETWPDHWIVVAAIEGDPFIFSANEETVLYAEHGRGSWDRTDNAFPDLPTLAACAAALGGVADGEEDLFDDETLALRSDVIDQARAALRSILGSQPDIAMTLGIFGWV